MPVTQTISPTGVASGEAFGAPSFSEHFFQRLHPVAIGPEDAYGLARIIAPGTALSLHPRSIASQEALGAVRVALQQWLGLRGKESDGAFGAPTVLQGGLLIAGIESEEEFGELAVLSTELLVQPVAIAPGEAFGAGSVTDSGPSTISPVGFEA